MRSFAVGNSRGLCRRPKIADTPPEIHFWREDIVENSDNSVQLPCRATPGAFISWFNSERTPVTALPNMEVSSSLRYNLPRTCSRVAERYVCPWEEIHTYPSKKVDDLWEIATAAASNHYEQF